MSKPKHTWIDITDILTDKGVAALRAGQLDVLPIKVGQVLIFDYEGSPTHMKIMRMDKGAGKVWGKEIELHSPDGLPTSFPKLDGS